MRASELRGLRWSDVDLDNATIHVSQRADFYGTIGSPKSKAGARDIPLTPLVVNTLKQHRLTNGGFDLVFANSRGRVRPHTDFSRRIWKPLQKACGMGHYEFHSLRHAAASLFIELGWGARPRGHTSLTGAVEVQIAVKKTGDKAMTALVECAKDLEEGAEVPCALERVELDTDPDGDMITSLVVVPAEATPRQLRDLNGRPKQALDCLFEALLDFGAVPSPSSHIPPNTRTTTLVRWEELFLAKTIAESTKPDSKKKAFVRAGEKLQELKIIGVWKDQVWVAGHAGHART
jgi:hypothetical protein